MMMAFSFDMLDENMMRSYVWAIGTVIVVGGMESKHGAAGSAGVSPADGECTFWIKVEISVSCVRDIFGEVWSTAHQIKQTAQSLLLL